ncbi:MAG: TatD family hydrolase [Phocaeicola sp.]|uniref:TatD family hydrolase n=1 Tax=Phocaeicola TaxID=909656 RepID=UPI00234ECC6B|nr:TatD family hydrolase [Phocaeicola oris]MCE2617156.1 TatD family hydrolase [Phocaeicola oris]
MIDTHAHLYGKEFDDDRTAVMQRAKDVGVERIFLPNEDETTLAAVLTVCEANPGFCYPMIGFHPECVDKDFKKRLLPMKELLQHKNPYIGIGEIGMDLYWDKTYLKEQQEVLEIQVQWAMEFHLPLMIHCRSAYSELFEILEPYKRQLTGVFHSFSGTEEEASKLLDYDGFMLGINGIVTFKKSTLSEVLASTVPLDRLVLETDSPYLAPVPYRGRRNESSFVKETAMKLSSVYCVGFGEIDRITTKNALKVFNSFV